MKQIDLQHWKEFGPKTKETIQELSSARESSGEFSALRSSEALFRGQSDATWDLKTTLERYSRRTWTISSYMERIAACADQLESFSNRSWNIPDVPKLEEEIASKYRALHPHIPCYPYWVHLRHHGFPSPLLDWTRSRYVAAYFAFTDADRSEDSRVAVFMYVEMPMSLKPTEGGKPIIKSWGPYVRTHKRHFLQQSCYTTATKDENNDHTFVSHSEVARPSSGSQDLLIKFTMPASDRIYALSELNEYNINHYSLFQTEDALARSLAFQEIGRDENSLEPSDDSALPQIPA